MLSLFGVFYFFKIKFVYKTTHTLKDFRIAESLTMNALYKKVDAQNHIFAFYLGTEEDVVKSKKTFRSQAVVNQNAETELMLEGDDDAVSLLQEKEIDNLAGN